MYRFAPFYLALLLCSSYANYYCYPLVPSIHLKKKPTSKTNTGAFSMHLQPDSPRDTIVPLPSTVTPPPAPALSTLDLHPNPTDSYVDVRVSAGDCREIEIQIIDRGGITVRSATCNNPKEGFFIQRIQVAGLDPGHYGVSVKTCTFSVHSRLEIRH